MSPVDPATFRHCGKEEKGPTYEVLRSRTVVWLAVLMVTIGIAT